MRRSTTILLLPLAAACASSGGEPWSGRELRVPQDVPVQFVTEDGSAVESGCRSPLVDPRDQSRLRLIRSAARGETHLGDYEVPSGRYGVGTRELLRIDCSTGEPLGIVPS
jgi:hypothetical protein